MEKKNQIPKYPHLRFPEFTDEWKEVKLGEVCSIRTGKLNANAMEKDGQYPFFTCAKEVYRINTFAFSGEALLISGNGANVGYIHYYNGRFNAYQRTYVLEQFNQDIRCIQYLLVEHLSRRIAIEKNEGNTPYIVLSTLTDMLLRLPSIPEQRKIAALLSLIDERVEVQNAIIKEQEVAKTLLSKELLTPEDDWTEYAVQDCLTYEQPAKYIVKHTDYSSDSTLTPVLTANKGFILGYTSEQGIYQKGACIIFDDFTLDCKYVPFAFKVKSSAIKILQARKGFDIRFMFEVIKSLSLSPFAHKRHYISEVEPIKVLVPSLAKQERISRLFAALDERLDVERAYAERLKQQKAYLLRQMFI